MDTIAAVFCVLHFPTPAGKLNPLINYKYKSFRSFPLCISITVFVALVKEICLRSMKL